MICTVCGSEILDWGDGCFDVADYDEYGNTLRYTCFDADAAITYESIHVYEYKYDNASKVWCRMYSFGILTRETFFNEDGDTEKEIEYLEDGSTETWLYNENGDTLSVTGTRTDGNIIPVQE